MRMAAVQSSSPMRTRSSIAGAPRLFLVERPHKQSRSRHSAHGPECRDRLYLWGRGIRKSRGDATVHCRRAPSTPTLLVKIFGRARVGFSTASGAVVMGEVGCVPLGRWQHTRRVAHASDECAIEREARIVFRICNANERGRNATDLIRSEVGARWSVWSVRESPGLSPPT